MNLSRYLKAQWQRCGTVVAAITGIVAIIIGWWGVSGATLVTEQLPYLASGAVFGLFALGVGATLWISADLRAEWCKLDEISELLGMSLGNVVDVGEAPDGESPAMMLGGNACQPEVAAPASASRR